MSLTLVVLWFLFYSPYITQQNSAKPIKKGGLWLDGFRVAIWRCGRICQALSFELLSL